MPSPSAIIAALALAVMLTTLGVGAMNAQEMTAQDNFDCKPMARFDTPEENGRWQVVNDNVMGGRSAGGMTFEGGRMIFEGAINTDGGGFSSVRLDMTPGAFEGYTLFRIRHKGDGRVYGLTFQTDERRWMRRVSYRGSFTSSSGGEWSVAEVRVQDFVPQIFGRRVSADPLDPSEIRQMGLIIADGIDGPFRLEVDEILACRSER